jgi:hypothetical protein
MGAYIRIEAKRYCAGFILIDGSAVIDSQSFSAPASQSEAGQLNALHARASDLVDRWKPELFALKNAELQGGAARNGFRAEGIVLGAVGRKPEIEVKTYVRQSLLKPAGLSSGRTPVVVDALCARIAPEPSDPEVRQAAAAAIALLAANT